jgi:hypothetical protein
MEEWTYGSTFVSSGWIVRTYPCFNDFGLSRLNSTRKKLREICREGVELICLALTGLQGVHQCWCYARKHFLQVQRGNDLQDYTASPHGRQIIFTATTVITSNLTRINLAQDMDQWRALVNTVLRFDGPVIAQSVLRRAGIRFPAEARDMSLLHSIRTGSIAIQPLG